MVFITGGLQGHEDGGQAEYQTHKQYIIQVFLAIVFSVPPTTASCTEKFKQESSVLRLHNHCQWEIFEKMLDRKIHFELIISF